MREVEIVEAQGIPFFGTRAEAMSALFPRNAVGAEFGVMRGTNAQNILDALAPSGLYLVDPWSNVERRYRNVKEKFAGQKSVSVIRATAKDAYAAMPELDWYEDDTSLGYEETYTHFCMYDKKVKTGGFVMIDYCKKDGKEVHKGRWAVIRKIALWHPQYIIVGFVRSTDSVILQKPGIPDGGATREAMYKRWPKGGTGLEIGVCLGENAENLLTYAAPKALHLVDCWDPAVHRYDIDIAVKKYGHYRGRLMPREESGDEAARMVAEKFAGDERVKIMRGFGRDIVPGIPDETLDWAYIDGDHSFEGCSEDLGLVLPKMKPDCIVAGHDWAYIQFAGVINAVRRFLREQPDFELRGVTRERWTKSWMLVRGNP